MDQAQYRYGRRQIVEYNVTGQPTYSSHPLDLLDFLDPNPGDEFAHGDDHDNIVALLFSTLATLLRANPFFDLLKNVKIVWSQAGIASPAPDIAVVRPVRLSDSPLQRYVVGEDGPEPQTIIEVTSPLFAALDVENKPAIYAQAGVPEYLIIHVHERPTSPANLLSISAFRLQDAVYQPIAPDATGKVSFLGGRAFMAIDVSTGDIDIVNARTGQKVVPAAEALQPKSKIAAEATQRAQSLASKLNLFGRE